MAAAAGWVGMVLGSVLRVGGWGDGSWAYVARCGSGCRLVCGNALSAARLAAADVGHGGESDASICCAQPPFPPRRWPSGLLGMLCIPPRSLLGHMAWGAQLH